jgi:virginiamycin B lyase
MMQNMETPIPADQWATVTDYLTKNFPERARPAAIVVPGPVEAVIKEWPVPTPGSRPHDPLATRDGAIWWTGQLANTLGRLDPRTGQSKEYILKTSHTGPHGLTEDKDGNIWFTGNNTALIGKLDPKSGAVTEYRMPNPDAKDPHTLIFDRDGVLWFTVQQANMVGRLDPATGVIKLVTSPTPKSRPYGMALNSKNMVFLVEFGTNKVASIDAKTMAISEYALPDPGARPRRIAISPDDRIWYTDFARGFLGRLDVSTGKVTEWPSPSGPKSEPYGIVFTKGALWYNESGAKPNTIVRFDPHTEKFQSWIIPGGGDIVRNMDVTRDGNPVLANSLTNEVGLVEIK